MTIPIVSFEQLAARYCESQLQDPAGLKSALLNVQKTYPDLTHFVMYECAMLDSSRMGQCVIMPIGPNNTFTSIDMLPKHWSPRGLASDISCPIMIMEITSLEK